MWLNKKLFLLLGLITQLGLYGQVTQMTTHQYGAYFSCGLSNGNRIPPATSQNITFTKPGQAIGMGGNYARNLSEYLWLQTGLDIHTRQWNWECDELTGNINYPSTTNQSRELWLTVPLQALIYTGHEQGRIFIAAGPAFSLLLHKSWQEENNTDNGNTLVTTRNESKELSKLHTELAAGLGTEIEINPLLFCRINLQFQNNWYKRQDAGRESSRSVQLALAIMWTK